MARADAATDRPPRDGWWRIALVASILVVVVFVLAWQLPRWPGTWIIAALIAVFALFMAWHPILWHRKVAMLCIGLGSGAGSLPSLNATFQWKEVAEGQIAFSGAPLIGIALVLAAVVFGLYDLISRGHFRHGRNRSYGVQQSPPSSAPNPEPPAVEIKRTATGVHLVFKGDAVKELRDGECREFVKAVIRDDHER